MPLSKSSFLIFLQCPSYFWFSENKPEVLAPAALSDFEQMLADQGKLVEKEFYKLFPDAKFISSKGPASIEETKSKAQDGAVYIAQAGFMTQDFFAQSDLVHFKGRKAEGQKGEMHIDIYEIKSSSSMQNAGLDDTAQAPSKEEHITDLAFQQEVATLAGYVVDTTYLVELNKQYACQGSLDLHSLFTATDVTTEVMQQLPKIREQMRAALSQSISSTQPVTCECKYKPRKKQCPAFAYLHPEVNGFTVYDLPRIHATRLHEFIDQGIIRIEDIPVKNKLSDNQQEIVQSWNSNQEIIHNSEIGETLNRLEFPLYFLDYETYAPAIPVFEGTRPYQYVPFQYSLHILHQPDSEIRHKEYLHKDTSNPVIPISQSLRADILDQGTIIVWHKTFEGSRNKELAYAVPQLAEFLLSLNNRMFDLKDIFSKHLYVHKDFRGSNSIKDVLPVLVPDLSYKNLSIQNGGHATSEWGRMIFGITNEEEKKIIQQQLLEYCKLDTLAMVEIYKKILEKIKM